MDSTNAKRSFLCLNPKKSEVWVVFPSSGQTACDTVAAWNWDADTWGIRTVSGVTCAATGLVSLAQSESWAADAETWEVDVAAWSENEFSPNEARLVLATNTPQIGLPETGVSDFGVALPWRLEKYGLNFDDADSVKVLRASRPHLDAPQGTVVNISHGSAMTANGGTQFSPATAFTVGVDNFANAFAPAGRYLAYRLEGSGPQLVKLRSYDLDINKQGRF